MAAKKKPAAKSRKSVIGRPPSYNAKFHPNMARILASQGLSDEDIAREIGIAVSTYYKWKKEKPAFSEAIKKAKRTRIPESRTRYIKKRWDIPLKHGGRLLLH